MKISIVIFFVFVVVIGTFVYFRKNQIFNIKNNSLDNSFVQKKEEREVPPNTHKYQNNHYQFSVFYPQGLEIKEFDPGDGSMTVVFQDISRGTGFQIFVVPYVGVEISKERFYKDVPTGVRKGGKSFYIGEILANSFYSSNLALGETYEVWFIYKNFLYEFTTVKLLEDFLNDIVKTLEFV
jgi:hypothetical protein